MGVLCLHVTLGSPIRSAHPTREEVLSVHALGALSIGLTGEGLVGEVPDPPSGEYAEGTRAQGHVVSRTRVASSAAHEIATL